ncbi:MAG: tRNA (guanosine(37)-N1)-methyltransferase TrmD [Brevibacterium aurantiacum]|uniref:tRNA (guanine-N(1)-)-methyltransferase n=1 Tax=Brevibacterium aurantiacum TaxID=273384 RepID=A0A2A3YVM6_BREAU|nr:tRNA (guanosine(37)-N1)-methyltransferase TrmD [Brevibacterium aurantiacum]MDN5737514.1 tRNA (guanosine(37)-N1)-methyltransferase TrmD [Brevibacterium aurantiacum]MDN5773826.1 tRNA (guanosine(37)-N1)-methyltransferase TrmD [Brevibacterium aurantiacum]PCC43376.1 tRNA (guanosine(37)-N1)-methyltransferase TrmD [Brevibacterium aurantiacum]PCC47964.1 tRNA (guanosine(37)-N1)-methyltransferase TrmD [Brevibacterium aurantiacum]PCC50073.1 tRNA (guanosine(37)-N1)-methyltransferase TrmD [Brevibacteriu
MKIDVVSIFPEYLAGLQLSLIGKAVDQGLLDLTVHDLRDFTFDRHNTVDDSPYGGGAGMVMKAEPWALALENILDEPKAAGAGTPQKPILIVPSPAGPVFNQRIAEELSEAEHLVFACGRYEGIDQRVIDWSAEHFDLRPMSIGDYVLNGGEVASMVMIEAVSRLVPGVIGNPESLTEESHEDGLLEYPIYTKPASWRGRDVPDILLSGNHGAIARWRRDRRLERTAEVRPDLLAELQDLDKHDRAVVERFESGDESMTE